MSANDADVVVVGSGGAGLVAACVAAEAGLDVALLERSEVFGGTTAVSGGMLWIPCNPLMAAQGLSDSREDALTYLARLSAGEVARERLEAFVDDGPGLVRYLCEDTPVRLFPIERPDYHSEWDGARRGGRTLDNLPFATAGYEGLAALAREGSHFPPLTYEERHRWRWPERFDWQLIAERMTSGVRTLGAALAAGLVAAARERGVHLVPGVRARELVWDGARVAGVRGGTAQGGEVVYRAARGVVLASGGFEWNAELKQTFLRGPEQNPVSPPWNVGDGLVMGLRAGAALGGMTEAWWVPTFNVPGEEYDGRPMARHVIDELALPGSLLVNRRGQRFVNEATNYNDLSKAFHVFDPDAYDHVNVPAWLVFDARFKRTYAVATVMASDDAPPWFSRGDTLAELAAGIGVDPAGLAATVERFNADAAEGVDRRFGRGEATHDRYYGDEGHAPNPCLAPLEEGPFYAVRIVPGSLGTKGGLQTDLGGRVLDHAGNPIPGLLACGNVAWNVMGPGYPGAGGTLGPALVGGLACGRTLRGA